MGPPVATLATGLGYRVDLVIYPSGPYLELIQTGDGPEVLAYSERLDSLVKIAARLTTERE